MNTHHQSFSTQRIKDFRQMMIFMIVAPAVTMALVAGVIYTSSNSANTKAAVVCNKTVTSGSAANAAASVSSGQTVCLTGTFSGGVISKAGVTITSTPGQVATVNGYMEIAANNVTLQNLIINGRGDVRSPFVMANNTTFKNNDISNTGGSRGICILLGPGDGSKTIDGTVIDSNRIHNCGVVDHDQGIYIAHTTRTHILNNYIYDNPDFGVQFYPESDGTVAEYNVFDGNAQNVVFSSESSWPTHSSNNILRYNILTNTTRRYNVEYYWGGGAVGSNNQVSNNCIFNGKTGNIQGQVGITVTGTTNADPLYINRGSKDFRVSSASPCAGYGPRTSTVGPSSSGTVSPPSPTPPPPAPSPPPPSPTPPPQPSSGSGQSPFGGNIRSLPGIIEAEDFDNGGEGIAYHDTDTSNTGGKYRTSGVDISALPGGGYYVSDTSKVEWLEYTVNVPAGIYSIAVNAATATGGTMRVTLNGSVLSDIAIPNTGGWETFQTVSKSSIKIPASTNAILRIGFVDKGSHLNKFTFTKTADIPITTPPPIQIPGSNPTEPVTIPADLPVEQDGTLIGDFDGDGSNDIAKDTNSDGKIDPRLEIVINGSSNPELTDTTKAPISSSDYGKLLKNNLSNNDSSDIGTITFKAGPLPEVAVAKPVAYTFLIAQGAVITGVAAYLAITKLSILAGIRARLRL